MRRASRWGLVCGLMFVCGAAEHAFGGDPYATGYVGPAWGYGGYRSIYSTESIPYFAEFPPVYYSHPVARSYGYSPFAYPAGVLTPRRPRQPETWRAASLDRLCRPGQCVADGKPLRVINPYVTMENDDTDDTVDNRVEVESMADRVQIVHPMELAEVE